MKNNSKDKDISLGRRHYWTDTQGQAHRVVFDDGKLEKPRATWIVLASVTLFALVFGVVVLLTTHPNTSSNLRPEAPKLYPNLRCARTIVSDADASRSPPDGTTSSFWRAKRASRSTTRRGTNSISGRMKRTSLPPP